MWAVSKPRRLFKLSNRPSGIASGLATVFIALERLSPTLLKAAINPSSFSTILAFLVLLAEDVAPLLSGVLLGASLKSCPVTSSASVDHLWYQEVY
jgi:uncharacterized MnhB-related membrane protein